MCAYCMVGDEFSRWNPPHQDWWKQHPAIPQPVFPNPATPPWPLQQAKEYLETLKQIKELEDKLGCPCEPNKADYIGLLEKLIEKLKADVA